MLHRTLQSAATSTHQRPHTFLFFFFNDTATTEIYTLSLHDALPISRDGPVEQAAWRPMLVLFLHKPEMNEQDRKSTRLNSSHSQISYAVFCLKKKKQATTSHASRLADTKYT